MEISKLKWLHGFSSSNRASLTRIGIGHCFYCETLNISADTITEWVDDDDTALCPICSIDSVIPLTIITDGTEYVVTDEDVTTMNNYYFRD